LWPCSARKVDFGGTWSLQATLFRQLLSGEE
jgi:hypothetical protein